jgi:3-oxoacyl-[acyl-carrier-protein] synthase-3
MKANIRDIAVYLPELIVTNDDLSKEFPDWNTKLAAQRAGVDRRHVAADNETALDLGYKACRKLFSANSNLREQVDTLIFCTQTPDYLLPSNACVLHKLLELPERVAAFDINLACSGYLYAVAIAHGMISAGISRHVLLVNGDTYTKLIGKQDRAARILFGDGAAATWVEGVSTGPGVLDISLGTAGADFDKFIVPAGGCRQPKSDATRIPNRDESGNVRNLEQIHMSGRDILAFVSSKIPRHVEELLTRNNLKTDDIELFIFHQASALVLETLTRLLRLPPKKVFCNMSNIGNTVSASIPIALKDATVSGLIPAGKRVLLCGFGVGLSWGSILLET